MSDPIKKLSRVNDVSARPRNVVGTFLPRPKAQSKTCTECGVEKDVAQYFVEANGYLGRRAKCVACLADHQRHYRSIRKKPRRVKKTIEQRRARDRAYYAKTKERSRVRRLAQSRRAHAKNRANPMYILVQRMRAGVSQSLKGSKQEKTERMLGYTAADLRNHLERQFLPGMSWQNIGQWHLDHIVPVSAFRFESHEDADFKRCWAVANLRPLWAQDNLRKGARVGFIL